MKRTISFTAPEVWWDDLQVGDEWQTGSRTITEPDLVAWVNLTWLTEGLFTNLNERDDAMIAGRLVPGALVFSFAEGLTLGAVKIKGIAFMHSEMTVKLPSRVGDTLHVRTTVTELRKTSRPDRALAWTSNEVVNQRGEIVLSYTALRMMLRRRETE